MKERVAQCIEEYNKLVGTNDPFYVSDFVEIVGLVGGPGATVRDYAWTGIRIALQTGFVIGYRKAKRERRKVK